MRLHRFYTGDKIKLKQDFWLRDEALLWQWNKVLRLRPDQELILFDGERTDRLYRLENISKTEAHLQLITELERKLPDKHIYLFWSLLKKDNNDFILQKCTELGVSNFIPLITERAVRTNFNIDRAHKIILEASEQCGRSNIPHIRDPLHLETALEEYADKVELFVCQEASKGSKSNNISGISRAGLMVGPEGGWSDNEKHSFINRELKHLPISSFTLRAETAAVVAVSKFL